MLGLTRREGETILIGTIQVVVLKTNSKSGEESRIRIEEMEEPRELQIETTVRRGDSFHLGGGIKIEVGAVRRKGLTLVIGAPLDIPIARGELIGLPPKTEKPALRAAIARVSFPGIH